MFLERKRSIILRNEIPLLKTNLLLSQLHVCLSLVPLSFLSLYFSLHISVFVSLLTNLLCLLWLACPFQLPAFCVSPMSVTPHFQWQIPSFSLSSGRHLRFSSLPAIDWSCSSDCSLVDLYIWRGKHFYIRTPIWTHTYTHTHMRTHGQLTAIHPRAHTDTYIELNLYIL